jgi:uncharacterized protein involved in exopolysaccharide biosynthesis
MGFEDKRGSHRLVSDVAHVIFKRKFFILFVFLAIMAGTVVGALQMPREYEATSIVLIKRDRSETPVSSSQGVGRDVSLRVNPDQDLRSEAALVQRRSLLRHVVRTLGPDNALRGSLPASEGPRVAQASQPEGTFDRVVAGTRYAYATYVDPVMAIPASIAATFSSKEAVPAEDQAIAALSTRLRVSTVEGSDVIKVSFRGEDRRFTESTLKLLLTEYLDRYLELRATPEAADFFEKQTQKLASDLRAAEDAVEAFDARHSISAVGRQREHYLTTALTKETAAQAAQSEIQELREKRRVLREQLAQLPEQVRVTEERRASVAADRIRGKLFDLENQRASLLLKYTEQDRRITDIDQEIARLKEQALAEPPLEFSREAYGENGVRQPVMTELIAAEAALVRAEIKAQNLQRETREFYDRLGNVDRAAYERGRLERRLALLDDSYRLHVKKYEEARIAAKMNESRIVNVTLAEPVQVVPKPGNGLLLTMLGGIVGLVSGVGLAFAREYFGDSFTTEDSVRHQLGVPVLTSIPDKRNNRIEKVANGTNGKNGKNGHNGHGKNGH